MRISPAPRRRPLTVVACLVASTITLVTAAAPAEARNRVTPGSFTGYGFDQCLAPSQQAMDTWLTTSPYWAVGIYISGESRGCPDQPNLTRDWVATQLRNGWRLLPLTVGPQASCSTRYKYQQDKIASNPAAGYAAARTQGRQVAATTVRDAQALGIRARSTLWYDIEAFSIAGTRCRESAMSFLSGWTSKLHQLHYVSGVYSSAASGIKMLDDAKASKRGDYALPDRVWIADWNGTADVSSAYVRPTSWMPHKRVHQYLGGHTETYGGVSINVDSNYLSLGRGSVAPKTAPACGVGINRADYHRLHRGSSGREVKALQCLLKRKGTYNGGMHGFFKRRTARAVRAFQRAHHLPRTGAVSLRMWTELLSGGSTPILKYGSVGEAVSRVQRAMNAAVDAHLPVTGVFESTTTQAVRRYQRLVGLAPNGVVAANTWQRLQGGDAGGTGLH